jgi:tRNA(Ile2) C34 agmatinyltransferase TiaS
MPRGGSRENAGRKTAWKNAETQVIRVPKVLVPKLMQIARKLDSGELLDFVTKSIPLIDDEPATGVIEISPDQLSLLDKVELVCPRCSSSKLKKNGKEAGRQRYKCLTCGKYFREKQEF